MTTTTNDTDPQVKKWTELCNVGQKVVFLNTDAVDSMKGESEHTAVYSKVFKSRKVVQERMERE